MVAELLGFVCKVVGIDADAMASDQPGPERQKIPLGTGCLEHLLRVDSNALENHREFVDQGNIDIPLRVLNNFGSFGNFDARCLVRPGSNNISVDTIDEVGSLCCRA